ncbi:hypothetical protein HZH66_011895 [Vespula vulgaris]|uniref:Uncharacterized protein n=1 Tax=Vespula vulgaris TaxID=7454 RepID=A0A834JCE2_VESVU|nr:hypothetical protein HZH66_011895 [Vespula vulgaris]
MAASRVDSNLEMDNEGTLTFPRESNYDDNEKESKRDSFGEVNDKRIAEDDREKVQLSNCNNSERIRKVSKVKEREGRDKKDEISDGEKLKGCGKNLLEADGRSSKFQRQVRGLRKQARIVTTATIEDRTINDRSISGNDRVKNLEIQDSTERSVKERNLIGRKVENHRTLKESTQERINVKESSMRNRVSPVKRRKSQIDKDIESHPPLFSSTSSSSYSDKERRNIKKCQNCGEQHYPYGRYSYLNKYSTYFEGDLGAYERHETSAKVILANASPVRGPDSRLETPVTSLLYRSRSLPRLSVHDSGVGCSANEQTVPGPGQHGTKQLVADLRQLLTLKQHYYPEGGWGWLVILVGMFVQILSHGTQGAVGVFVQHVANRFGHHVYLESAQHSFFVSCLSERNKNIQLLVALDIRK